MRTETLLVIEPTHEHPRNSEGSLIRLRNGHLTLVYSRFHGGAADNSGAEIVCRTSVDEGHTWSADRVLISHEGLENVMSVSLLRLPSGEVLLGYLAKNGWGDCRYFVRRSSDDLATLGPRICVTPDPGYYVVNNDRMVRLSSGRLVVPAALHPCADGTVNTWDRRGMAMALLSDDEGQSWTSSIDRLELPSSGSGLQEPGIVELRDRRLWMWMRTDQGAQYKAFSADGGSTWAHLGLSALASPLSPASAKRLPESGDLLLVWNDHSGRHPYPAGRRTPLCAALSADDGRSWTPSWALETDPDGWYCYTSITPDVSGSALLSYCAGDSTVGGLNRLKVVRLSDLANPG